MKVLEYAGVMVFACVPDVGLPRNERERVAVAALLREAFGGDAPKVSHTPSGAPLLDGCDCTISISHCAGCVVLAVCAYGRRLGIDAECRGRGAQLQRVARKFLSPGQMEAWGVGAEPLLRAWTIKEAVYKAALTPGLPLCDIPLPSSPDIFGQATATAATTIGLNGNSFSLFPVVISGFDGLVTLAVEFF